MASTAPLALVGPGGRLPLDRRTIEALAELFVGLLDIAQADPDCEADDQGTTEGGDSDWLPGDPQDAEESHDAELETWAHPDDHPAELFRGRRPADEPEAA
jgi:hypothetical protein